MIMNAMNQSTPAILIWDDPAWAWLLSSSLLIAYLLSLPYSRLAIEFFLTFLPSIRLCVAVVARERLREHSVESPREHPEDDVQHEEAHRRHGRIAQGECSGAIHLARPY